MDVADALDEMGVQKLALGRRFSPLRLQTTRRTIVYDWGTTTFVTIAYTSTFGTYTIDRTLTNVSNELRTNYSADVSYYTYY